MIVDGGPGDRNLLFKYIDEWKQDEQSQEILSKVKADKTKIFESVYQHSTMFFDQGKHSFQAVLHELLIPNYIVLCDNFFNEEYLENAKHTDANEIFSSKKWFLKQMFICFFNIRPEDSSLHKEILQALYSIDNSQINDQEVIKIPIEYLRQLCGIEEVISTQK